MATIIGLTGKKRSGKDTFISYLEESTNSSVASYAFARPIYAMLSALLGGQIPRDDDGSVNKNAIITKYGVTVRELLQTLGTEWGRNCIHKDIWVIGAREWLSRRPELYNDYIVFSDIRFDNEASFVKEVGGKIVEINRRSPLFDKHISESSIDAKYVDYCIDNTGTIEGYYRKIGGVMRRLHDES